MFFDPATGHIVFSPATGHMAKDCGGCSSCPVIRVTIPEGTFIGSPPGPPFSGTRDLVWDGRCYCAASWDDSGTAAPGEDWLIDSAASGEYQVSGPWGTHQISEEGDCLVPRWPYQVTLRDDITVECIEEI
jgi:hypothetical protein